MKEQELLRSSVNLKNNNSDVIKDIEGTLEENMKNLNNNDWEKILNNE